LIIDVRGNTGCIIECGERILQLLTPGCITPASFQFLNTALVRHVIKLNPQEDFAGFGLDDDTGSVYSQAAQITSTEDGNSVGQRYYGRVALVTDALCYSTTDMFAAGFQDHRIGPVVGVDRSTGAGGANVWKYSSHLEPITDHEGRKFGPLFGDSDLSISVRHCIRSGRSKGQILEDFGVTPDYPYFMTERDLFGEPNVVGKDKGLYEFALGKLFGAGGLRDLSVDLRVFRYSPGNDGTAGHPDPLPDLRRESMRSRYQRHDRLRIPGAPGRM
jgi:hypothetical protein